MMNSSDSIISDNLINNNKDDEDSNSIIISETMNDCFIIEEKFNSSRKNDENDIILIETIFPNVNINNESIINQFHTKISKNYNDHINESNCELFPEKYAPSSSSSSEMESKSVKISNSQNLNDLNNNSNNNEIKEMVKSLSVESLICLDSDDSIEDDLNETNSNDNESKKQLNQTNQISNSIENNNSLNTNANDNKSNGGSVLEELNLSLNKNLNHLETEKQKKSKKKLIRNKSSLNEILRSQKIKSEKTKRKCIFIKSRLILSTSKSSKSLSTSSSSSLSTQSSTEVQMLETSLKQSAQATKELSISNTTNLTTTTTTTLNTQQQTPPTTKIFSNIFSTSFNPNSFSSCSFKYSNSTVNDNLVISTKVTDEIKRSINLECDLNKPIEKLTIPKNNDIKMIDKPVETITNSSISSQDFLFVDNANNQQQLPETQPKEPESLNYILYDYGRENPTIRIESGSLFESNVESIVSTISKNVQDTLECIKSTYLSRQLYDIYGQNLVDELKKYANLLYIPNEMIYQIAFTNHLVDDDKRRFKRIFHVYLDDYDYTSSQQSELSFKSLVRNVLKIAKDSCDLKSIGFPMIGTGMKGYPKFLIFKWFEEAFKEYCLSASSSPFDQLKNIRLIIPQNDSMAIKSFEKFLQRKNNRDICQVLSDGYELVALDSVEDEEFDLVSRHFYITMRKHSATILKIEKVNNVTQENFYLKSKEAMHLKYSSKNKPIERKLFHGTCEDTIKEICKYGFNRSYSGKNGVSYGQGVYFARDASYSHNYSKNSNNINYTLPKRLNNNKSQKQNKNNANNDVTGTYQMILARVLIGDYEKGFQSYIDTGLKPDGTKYDSTVDNITDPGIFVIYRDYQAYPDYIITYS